MEKYEQILKTWKPEYDSYLDLAIKDYEEAVAGTLKMAGIYDRRMHIGLCFYMQYRGIHLKGSVLKHVNGFYKCVKSYIDQLPDMVGFGYYCTTMTEYLSEVITYEKDNVPADMNIIIKDCMKPRLEILQDFRKLVIAYRKATDQTQLDFENV